MNARLFNHMALVGGVLIYFVTAMAFGAEETDTVPALPAGPPGGGLPTLPGLPGGAGLNAPAPFGAPDASFGAPGAFGGLGASPGMADGAVPTPPPLTGLVVASDTASTGTDGATASSGPTDSYIFLFRDDPELGVVRERFIFDEGKKLREQEIQRLSAKYGGGQPGAPAQPGQPGAPQTGADPRAGAEWDLYYEQLEMYTRYVKEKLLPEVPDLPDSEYDPANYLQEWKDLRTEYDKAAKEQVNTELNENLSFYERLQNREDRRRDYYEWLSREQQKLDEWTRLWARKITGTRWADGELVRRDDWYYGIDFNSKDPFVTRIANREFLISREPQDNVPAGQLNVLTTNLTPYDLVDATGEMKNPEMERLRGTLVMPPVSGSVVATTGALELVQ
jgi:hypothetical protein